MARTPTNTFLPLLESPRPMTKINASHPTKQVIYIVIQAATSNDTHTFKIRGSYQSLKDANNKVVELWEGEARLRKGRESHGTKGDGRLWWSAESNELGDMTMATIKKSELIKESGEVEKVWLDD
ncbi:hypothetical protein BDZ45DRAFT_686779 [Acephala macrosclerotiorum]|nr:hypothetical protein BDZ45DRAFT_686779 [Acephala macrosclerotiorum]